VYDLLLRYNLHIVGEKSVPISHCLLVNKGVRREDLTRVLSHPQALAQCDEYLRDMAVVREAVDDTAGGLQRLLRSRWLQDQYQGCAADACQSQPKKFLSQLVHRHSWAPSAVSGCLTRECSVTTGSMFNASLLHASDPSH
jgi:hypothetical protein